MINPCPRVAGLGGASVSVDVLKTNYGGLSSSNHFLARRFLRCLVLFHGLRKLLVSRTSPQPHVNGSISWLLFAASLLAQQCAVIVIGREGVIANFHVVAASTPSPSRSSHLSPDPAGTRSLVVAGVLRWWRRFWRWSASACWHGRDTSPQCKDVWQWVRIAALSCSIAACVPRDDASTGRSAGHGGGADAQSSLR